MTTLTTDTPVDTHRRATDDRMEYRFYFALIFLLTLPAALLCWALSMLRLMPRRDCGPVAVARGHARTITPMIFCG
ncbi:cytochrome PufQ [Jannaschia sp. S6380]|uniref:cytochrome PufQ n=1 Tax=Jannaschia sp. S6380 TaxID=2926408 RepID=UPI001FF5BE60|nr:cytochrome PufQ [Jannaschia sp. S6380]MCK0167676.1 cytochrome PufQ [Jannaschia sp. S6380]